MLIYITGVVAGSLAVAIVDPHIYLAGGSGGVYALITAHLANVIFNWSEMKVPAWRLLSFMILAGVDIGMAVYYRYVGHDTKVRVKPPFIKYVLFLLSILQVSYTGHIAGAVVGLLLGIVILRNIRSQTWERALWWCCLLVFRCLLIATIVWNAVEIFK